MMHATLGTVPFGAVQGSSNWPALVGSSQVRARPPGRLSDRRHPATNAVKPPSPWARWHSYTSSRPTVKPASPRRQAQTVTSGPGLLSGAGTHARAARSPGGSQNPPARLLLGRRRAIGPKRYANLRACFQQGVRRDVVSGEHELGALNRGDHHRLLQTRTRRSAASSPTWKTRWTGPCRSRWSAWTVWTGRCPGLIAVAGGTAPSTTSRCWTWRCRRDRRSRGCWPHAAGRRRPARGG